jgi:hypothetical protein
VHEKLSDPDFCKGFVEEQQRLAVEEERERCVRIARTEVLVREKARRMGAGTTPEDFARKVEAAMRQGE